MKKQIIRKKRNNCLINLEKDLVVNHEHNAYAKRENLAEEKNNSSFVGHVMMLKSNELNDSFVFIYHKLQDKALENMNSSFSSKFIHQRFVMSWVHSNIPYLIFKNFSKKSILFTTPINLPLALGMNDNGIYHSSNISSTEFNLIKGPFFLCSNSLINSSFNDNSSTGCQSIFSQNFQSLSESLPVFIYFSNTSFLFNFSLATSDQFTHDVNFIKLNILLSNENVKLTIYLPLFLNSSNLLSSSTFSSTPSLATCAQFISGILSNFLFNSLGMDTVNLFILSSPNSFVSKRKCVQIYKCFGQKLTENTCFANENIGSISNNFNQIQKIKAY